MGRRLDDTKIVTRDIPLSLIDKHPDNYNLKCARFTKTRQNGKIQEQINILRLGAANTIDAKIHLLRRCILDTIPPRGSGFRKWLASLPPDKKFCPACERVLDLDEFHVNQTQSKGRACHCIQCKNARGRSDYDDDKKHEYYKKHYENTKEEWNQRSKEWHAANREEHNKRNLLNHQIHKERYNAKKKAWRKAHPEWVAAQHSKRRALRKGNGGSFTQEEWRELKQSYAYTCLRCLRSEPEIELTADHVLPLVMGGTSDIENIQPLCRSCNSWKCGKHIDYREAFLDEEDA